MIRKPVLLVALVLLVPVTTAVAFHPNTQCYRCHVPHEDESLAGMPLWSGEATAIESWTNYTSGTLDATAGDPEGSTLVCLACHDGAEASSHDISDGTGDLSGTHPMEFVYDEALALADKELVNPDDVGSSTEVNGEGTITEDFLAGGAAGTKKMNCVSCHEIHINGLHGEAVVVEGENPGDPPQAEFDFDLPHLKPIPGIEMKKNWGATGLNEADYYVAWGALCTTCHIK